MKIAFLRKKYTFHGGAEGFTSTLVTRLAEAGNDIHIYAIKWDGIPAPNISVHKVPTISLNSFLRDLSFAVSSYFMVRKEKFDIVQSHDKTLYQDIYRAGDGCHISWLKRRWKMTGALGKLAILCNPYHWLILLIERTILKGHRYRKIIAISEMVKRDIISNYQVDASDIDVIYNGVDLDKYNPQNRLKYRRELLKEYGLDESAFVILFVGSGFERKGVEYLIRAVELLKQQVVVLIVGKGSESRYVKFINKQKVIFCGPRKDAYRYYGASDIFVFPTIYEPFGNVHLEALATGLPVITTSYSGAAEIIRDGVHGFVVSEPENIQEIAYRISLLAEIEKRKEIGVNARQLAENFSLDVYLAGIMRLYESVIAEKKSLSR